MVIIIDRLDGPSVDPQFRAVGGEADQVHLDSFFAGADPVVTGLVDMDVDRLGVFAIGILRYGFQ